MCAAAAEVWVNRYSTFSQGIVMARPSKEGINYWISRNETITRWWRRNLAATARALCEATDAAGFGRSWWPKARAAATPAPPAPPAGEGGAAAGRRGRVVVVVSKPRDADRRALMRVKLGAAGVGDYRVVDGLECRAHRPCAQQLAALARAVRHETKTNFTQVRRRVPSRSAARAVAGDAASEWARLRKRRAAGLFESLAKPSMGGGGRKLQQFLRIRCCASAWLVTYTLDKYLSMSGRAREQAGSLLAPRDWPPSAAMLGEVSSGLGQ